MPAGGVWDWHCLQRDVPGREEWMDEIKKYERDVLMRRETP